MSIKTSENILSAATGLLGFCFVVITSIHLNDATENTVIDELTSIISVLLIFSCIASFIKIRSNDSVMFIHWGKIADYLFLISLMGMMGIIVLVAFKFLNI